MNIKDYAKRIPPYVERSSYYLYNVYKEGQVYYLNETDDTLKEKTGYNASKIRKYGYTVEEIFDKDGYDKAAKLRNKQIDKIYDEFIDTFCREFDYNKEKTAAYLNVLEEYAIPYSFEVFYDVLKKGVKFLKNENY